MNSQTKTFLPWFILVVSLAGMGTVVMRQQFLIKELSFATPAPEAVPTLSAREGRSPRSLSPEAEEPAVESKRTLLSKEEDGLYFPEKDPQGIAEAARRIESQVEASTNEILDIYVPVYGDLDLSGEQQARFATKLAELEEKRAVLAEVKRDLQTLRYQYDRNIREILHPDEYERYRDIENSRIPEEIIGGIAKVGEESGLPPLTDHQRAWLGQKLVDLGATAGRDDSFGPYGGETIVTVGVEDITRTNGEKIARLDREHTALVNAPDSPLDPGASEQLTRFYDERKAEVQARTNEAIALEKQLQQESAAPEAPTKKTPKKGSSEAPQRRR